MKKKMKLGEIQVKSFVTGSEQVMGGCGSIPTGRHCPAICSEETFCPSECCFSVAC